MKIKHWVSQNQKAGKKNIISPSHDHKAQLFNYWESWATLVCTHPYRQGCRGPKKSFLSKRLHVCSKIRPAAPMIAACTAASPPPSPRWIFHNFPLAVAETPKDLVHVRTYVLVWVVSRSIAMAGRPPLLHNGPKSTREPSILCTVLFAPPSLSKYTYGLYLPCLPMFGRSIP
jgi:hypothetical protein